MAASAGLLLGTELKDIGKEGVARRAVENLCRSGSNLR